MQNQEIAIISAHLIIRLEGNLIEVARLLANYEISHKFYIEEKELSVIILSETVDLPTIFKGYNVKEDIYFYGFSIEDKYYDFEHTDFHKMIERLENYNNNITIVITDKSTIAVLKEGVNEMFYSNLKFLNITFERKN